MRKVNIKRQNLLQNSWWIHLHNKLQEDKVIYKDVCKVKKTDFFSSNIKTMTAALTLSRKTGKPKCIWQRAAEISHNVSLSA